MIRRKDRFRLMLSIDLITRSVMFEMDEADAEPVEERRIARIESNHGKNSSDYRHHGSRRLLLG